MERVQARTPRILQGIVKIMQGRKIVRKMNATTVYTYVCIDRTHTHKERDTHMCICARAHTHVYIAIRVEKTVILRLNGKIARRDENASRSLTSAELKSRNYTTEGKRSMQDELRKKWHNAMDWELSSVRIHGWIKKKYVESHIVYVCAPARACVCVRVRVRARMRLCTSACYMSYTYMWCACVRARTHAHTNTYRYICIYTYLDTYIRVFIYIYRYAYRNCNTRTRTQMQRSKHAHYRYAWKSCGEHAWEARLRDRPDVRDAC